MKGGEWGRFMMILLTIRHWRRRRKLKEARRKMRLILGKNQ